MVSAITHAVPADHAHCRTLLREGSRSFNAAARLLPTRTRFAATALYAFCRLADDAVDLAPDSAEALMRLRRRLDRVYGGRPVDQPVDRALADLVTAYGIPKSVLQALFEGFEWDAAGKRYETISDVRAYGVRVAATVGVMMSLLMGIRHRPTLARACDLGVAMQLTNIARDVGEDANAGRLYLPADWMRQAGIDPEEWLASPVMNPSLATVVAKLLAEADRLYRRAEAGISHLPRRCRPGIQAARLIYDEIGVSLGRHGHDSVSRRTVVSGGRKVVLMARAMANTPWRARPLDEAVMAEAIPLLEAVDGAAATTKARPGYDDRMNVIFSVFDRLERHDYGKTRERD